MFGQKKFNQQKFNQSSTVYTVRAVFGLPPIGITSKIFHEIPVFIFFDQRFINQSLVHINYINDSVIGVRYVNGEFIGGRNF